MADDLRGRLLRAYRTMQSGRWLAEATSVGDGVQLAGRPFVRNRGRLSFGDRVFVGSQPVQSHFVVGAKGELVIEHGVVISYGAAFAAEQRIRVGSGTRIGPFITVMDTDYHVAGDRNSVAEPRPIDIGENVVIESRVTILRGSIIGDGARLLGGSVVTGTVPAGVTVAGVPAIRAALATDVLAGTSLDIASVVMSTLNLPSLPALDHGPQQIVEWDSFGSLKLLLALERVYQVTIREENLKRALTVGDLAALVETARQAT